VCCVLCAAQVACATHTPLVRTCCVLHIVLRTMFRTRSSHAHVLRTFTCACELRSHDAHKSVLRTLFVLLKCAHYVRTSYVLHTCAAHKCCCTCVCYAHLFCVRVCCAHSHTVRTCSCAAHTHNVLAHDVLRTSCCDVHAHMCYAHVLVLRTSSHATHVHARVLRTLTCAHTTCATHKLLCC